MVIRIELFGETITLRPACECRLKDLEEREKAARIANLCGLIRAQGLDDGLYAQMSLESWKRHDSSSEEAAKKLEAYLRNVGHGARNWLFLYGDYGLGKTHLAVSALRYLCLNRQWEPLFIKWSEYCGRIQQSWNDPAADSEYDLWRKPANVPLLVLDDIDKRASSEWALGKLYDLIDHRYVRRLPTILTANRGIEALAGFWGRSPQMKDLSRAITSRIVGQLSAAIEFSGKDYRLGKAEVEKVRS
ncbi:MAG TPA: ATP-binding protein [Syntrophobacteraceae bacterium]|nr:ATP-binding protein [Syntrophobacteraceae bacterium]